MESELVAAVIALLTDRLEWPVYELAPPDAPLPYVTLSSLGASDESTSGRWGWRVRLTVSCWSGAAGGREARAMGAAVHAALHRTKDLVLPSWHVAGVTYRAGRLLRDPDGVWQYAQDFDAFVFGPAAV